MSCPRCHNPFSCCICRTCSIDQRNMRGFDAALDRKAAHKPYWKAPRA